jgi:hypothetical protein
MAGFCGTGKRDHRRAAATDSGPTVVHHLFFVRNMFFFWGAGYWSVSSAVVRFGQGQWSVLNASVIFVTHWSRAANALFPRKQRSRLPIGHCAAHRGNGASVIGQET